MTRRQCKKRNTREVAMLRTLFKILFAFIALGVLGGGAAFAQECSGSITAEEVLRAEDARYAAQIANDFAAMEQMFGPELVYIRSVDGAVADKNAYIDSMRSGAVKYRAMRRSDVGVRTYGCLAVITGLFELDLTLKSGDLSEQSRFHSVWAKRGQGVQFVSWQSTRVPPKQ
jgi:uncharacterized protein DUF4440